MTHEIESENQNITSKSLNNKTLEKMIASVIMLLRFVDSEEQNKNPSKYIFEDSYQDTSNGLLNWLKNEYKIRAKRKIYFPDFVTSEPCWDMLLELARARLENEEISVSSICIASHAPQSTALRWIKFMEDEGLVERRPDAEDKRRIHVKISNAGLKYIDLYFREISKY